MKVQIKQLAGNEWKFVPVEKLEGKSICDYLLEHHGRCVVAMYFEDDVKPCVFFVNKTEDLDIYKKRGSKVFHAQDVAEFLSSPVKLSLVAQAFEGSTFIEMGTLNKKE
jgi:hypothetical protein